MRKLNSIENTYTIFRDEEEVGTITFLKHVENKHNEWRILTTRGNLPVSTVHWNAEAAKEILGENGLTWKAGENKKRYLYYDPDL